MATVADGTMPANCLCTLVERLRSCQADRCVHKPSLVGPGQTMRTRETASRGISVKTSEPFIEASTSSSMLRLPGNRGTKLVGLNRRNGHERNVVFSHSVVERG